MNYEILESEIVESYSLNDIYEEIENFSEMTSDLVEKIRSESLLTSATQYLNNLKI